MSTFVLVLRQCIICLMDMYRCVYRSERFATFFLPLRGLLQSVPYECLIAFNSSRQVADRQVLVVQMSDKN